MGQGTSKSGHEGKGSRRVHRRERVNKAVRSEDYDRADQLGETGEWLFKHNTSLRALGSFRTNTWTGSAADLANRDAIAVTPTYALVEQAAQSGRIFKSVSLCADRLDRYARDGYLYRGRDPARSADRGGDLRAITACQGNCRQARRAQ